MQVQGEIPCAPRQGDEWLRTVLYCIVVSASANKIKSEYILRAMPVVCPLYKISVILETIDSKLSTSDSEIKIK